MLFHERVCRCYLKAMWYPIKVTSGGVQEKRPRSSMCGVRILVFKCAPIPRSSRTPGDPMHLGRRQPALLPGRTRKGRIKIRGGAGFKRPLEFFFVRADQKRQYLKHTVKQHSTCTEPIRSHSIPWKSSNDSSACCKLLRAPSLPLVCFFLCGVVRHGKSNMAKLNVSECQNQLIFFIGQRLPRFASYHMLLSARQETASLT